MNYEKIEDKFKILDSVNYNGDIIEILGIPNLEGAQDIEAATQLFFAQQSGLMLKQIRIKLKKSTLTTESGALYYYNGNINVKSEIGGVGGLFKKAIQSAINNETVIHPSYIGEGEIYLEPSFKHYLIIELNNTELIVDKSAFYCCLGNINISVASQKNLSSAMLGGEGLFQTKITGTGVVVLEFTVPLSEIQKIEIKDGQTLKVDGNFVIARTGDVHFTVTKSEKNSLNSYFNGEGLLNTFTGKGIVWLAPTAPIYKKLESGIKLAMVNKNMNNKK